MNIKLEVIRINEDVIATSCESAIFLGIKEDGKKSWIKENITLEYVGKQMLEKYGDGKNAIRAIEDAINKYGYFHVLDDGTIEKCDDKTKHQGSGWEKSDYLAK